MKEIDVYIVDKKSPGGKVLSRKIVRARVIEERKYTYLVELPNGRQIIRKKKRDIPNAQQS